MTVYVFGNPETEIDSLPSRLLPSLRKKLPTLDFQHKDPNETWELADGDVILDAAVGVTEPRVFRDLADFEAAPTLTMHDFDLYADLRLRQKIGRLPRLAIIALPPEMKESDALAATVRLLNELNK